MGLPQQSAPSGRRETRLLVVTIAVALGMLLVLARFRFPEADRAVIPPERAPAPLERLAARATYDELASIMADLERRLAPGIVVLRLEPDAPGSTFVPAPRLTANRAVALVGFDERIGGVNGTGPPPIIARDAVRELVVVQVDSRPTDVPPMRMATARPGPRYLTIVDGTPQGPVVRPVYVGRTDLIQDPKWTMPLLSIAAVQQALVRGSAVYSLDGTLIGLATTDTAGSLTVIPAEALRSIAEAARPAPALRGDLGVEVQAMTTALARAAGAARGVMVSFVEPRGPAAAVLEPGDVVVSVDGREVTTIADFQFASQTRTPGKPVSLGVVRRSDRVDVEVVARQAPPVRVRPLEIGNDSGAVFRTVPGVGSEVVTVEPYSSAARAGLQRGDIILRLDSRPTPDAAAIQRAYARADAPLLLTIQRGMQHRVIALERP